MGKRRLRAALAAAAMLGAAQAAHAVTLTWDSSGTHPTGEIDGSGAWSTSVVGWSTGGADQAWVNGNAAVIGHGNGVAPYSITLGTNISASSLTFLNAGTGSYTLNGSGFTLTTTGSWNVSNGNVTLTNGTFVDGSNSTTAENIVNNGSLTLGANSIYRTAQLLGDSTGTTPNNSNVYFNGATLQPTLSGALLLSQTGHAYIGAGGLIVDTSRVSSGTEFILDPLLSGAANDGGLTLNGGGEVYIGYDEYLYDPANTYNGPTIVNNGALVIDTSGNTAVDPNGFPSDGKGPFENSNFTINPNGQIIVTASDGLIGEIGTNTMTINGGILTAAADQLVPALPTSCYIGNTSLSNFGEIVTDSVSSFEFIQNSVLHVSGVAFLDGNRVGFETGAAINIDSGGLLIVTSNIIDAVPFEGTGVGQLTLNGSGELEINTPLGTNNVVGNSFQGPVTINGGELNLNTANTATGMFPSSPLITINSGGELLLGQSNTLIGTSNGSTAVVVNSGGELNAASLTSNHIGNLTMNGGIWTSSGTANASGTFIFVPGSNVLFTRSVEVSAQGIVFPSGVPLNVSAGSVVMFDGALGLVDSSPSLTGQLTTIGGGAIQLYGSNTFSGKTNISSGSVTLESTGALTKTSSITVASGASFIDAGALTSDPAVVVNGTAIFGPNFNTSIQVLNLSSLTVGTNLAGGSVSVVPNSSHSNRMLLVTGGLSLSGTTNAWTSKLDLGNNDLDVKGGSLTTVYNQLKEGYNGSHGYWNGAEGIVSSSTASDTTYLTTLGVILNTTNGTTPLYGTSGALGLFDGTSPGATDVLVKLTYYGDTNLDGVVDGTDYARIDNGFGQKLTGWYNGDFNYDGVVNGSDYTLMDNAFNQQGASLADQVATATAQISGTTAVPEPAALSLLGMTAIGLLSRRNRHQRNPKAAWLL